MSCMSLLWKWMLHGSNALIYTYNYCTIMLLITCTTSLASGTIQSHSYSKMHAKYISSHTETYMHTCILTSHMHIYTHMHTPLCMQNHYCAWQWLLFVILWCFTKQSLQIEWLWEHTVANHEYPGIHRMYTAIFYIQCIYFNSRHDTCTYDCRKQLTSMEHNIYIVVKWHK